MLATSLTDEQRSHQAGDEDGGWLNEQSAQTTTDPAVSGIEQIIAAIYAWSRRQVEGLGKEGA